MGRLAAKHQSGVCLRVEREEINDSKLLADSVTAALDLLGCPAEQVDLVLDLGFVGKDGALPLRTTVIEAAKAIASIGRFRNLVIAGGSVPEQLPKRDTGVVRRVPRIEFDMWSEVHALAGSAG